MRNILFPQPSRSAPGFAHRRRNRRTGAAMVEFAIVSSVILLAIMGIIEFGRMLFVMNISEYAAREGARMAAVAYTSGNVATATSDIHDHVINSFAGQSFQVNNLNVNIVAIDPVTGNTLGTWDTAKQGELIAVQVTGDYMPIISAIIPASVFPNGLPIRAQASMFSEGN